MPKGHSVTSTSAIRDHYDRLSAFYRLWWGEHIHHGYWVAGESPAQAQAQLTQRLAAEAGVPRGASVLDVGCGFGASARWLAARLDCRVLGITLSRVQARRAAEAAQREGLDGRLRFAVHDAGDLDTVGGGPFDVVWIIECSEHLPDRARFFASCGRLLRPGGTLALCAWLRGPATEDRPPAALERLCRGMLCPMLSSPAEIRRCI
ncbi:MAG: methyltransferase domain-containing protein, partial [Planctomycetes bacterium]|nr:methyltransferase domain-containing protein [Planctomycetota bacterium]